MSSGLGILAFLNKEITLRKSKMTRPIILIVKQKNVYCTVYFKNNDTIQRKNNKHNINTYQKIIGKNKIKQTVLATKVSFFYQNYRIAV